MLKDIISYLQWIGEVLLQFITSLFEAIPYVFGGANVLQALSAFVPSPIATVVLAMVVLSILFLIAGRVK